MTDTDRGPLPTYACAGVTPYAFEMMVIDEDTGMEYDGLVYEINTAEGWAIIYADPFGIHDRMDRVEGNFRLAWYDDNEALAKSTRVSK